MNTIKYYLWKDRDKNSFDLFVTDNGIGLKIEGLILLIITFAIFAVLKWNMISSIPLILSILNLISIGFSVEKSKNNLKKNSFKWQIQYEMSILLMSIQSLSNLMKDKQTPQEEIKKWATFYINKVVESKSLSAIKDSQKLVTDHFTKISQLPFPDIKEKAAEKFMQKELEAVIKIYYPQFYLDLDNGKFAAKKKVTKATSTSNKNLDNALKTLGLPPSIRDMSKIKARYRQLVTMYHPDKNKSLTQEECHIKIAEVNGAYQEIEVLIKTTVI